MFAQTCRCFTAAPSKGGFLSRSTPSQQAPLQPRWASRKQTARWWKSSSDPRSLITVTIPAPGYENRCVVLKLVEVPYLISEFAGLPSQMCVHMKLLELEQVNTCRLIFICQREYDSAYMKRFPRQSVHPLPRFNHRSFGEGGLCTHTTCLRAPRSARHVSHLIPSRMEPAVPTEPIDCRGSGDPTPSRWTLST